jgi:molybdopterin-binding protein
VHRLAVMASPTNAAGHDGGEGHGNDDSASAQTEEFFAAQQRMHMQIPHIAYAYPTAGRESTDDQGHATALKLPQRGRRGGYGVALSGISMDEAIRIGAAATALGVSIDTLRRWERDGRVTFERRGQQRYMSSDELARLLRERAASGGSARNRLAGIVLAIRRDEVMAQVDMACGPHRIVSLMTREAADQLGLKPGDSATAVIKATTVVVERA